MLASAAAPSIQLSAILILLSSDNSNNLARDLQTRSSSFDYNEHCGLPSLSNKRSLRIVGGSKTASGAWPWQVAVYSGKQIICGGTLIDKEFVLTAAHCLRSEMLIVAGEYNLSEKDGSEQERKVHRIFRHPNYNDKDVDNDIALLKLSSPLRLKRDEVWPACLPEQNEELSADTQAKIVGWGATSYRRQGDGVPEFGRDDMLQEATVPVVDFAQCRRSYGAGLNDKHVICAGYRDGKIDSCQGDSGGGLLIQKDNRWHVFGVTSFGDECAKENAYGIYTRTAFYVNWMRRIMRKSSGNELLLV